MTLTEKPYIIRLAEIIYFDISKIKQNNPKIPNVEAIDRFIGTKKYEEISSGEFHDTWFNDLKKNKFIDKETGKKIPVETIKLLEVQKNTVMKQLSAPGLYHAKTSYPLENSQNSFNLLWRMCESYELWCKESNQTKFITLNIID